MTRPQRGSALAVDYRQVLSGPDLGTGSSADELDDEHRAASSDAENVDPLAPNSMQTAQVRKEGARDTTTVSHGIKRQRMDGGSSESDAAESEDDEYKASSSSSEASEGVVEDEDSSASDDAQEEPSDDESVVSMAGAVDQQEADAVPVPASTIDLHRRLSRFINALLIACLRSSVATGLSMMEPDRANQKQFRTKKGEDMDASAAAAHSSDLPVPTGDRLLIAMPDVVTGLHECCIPGCPKQFKVFPSIKYHLEHFPHDLFALCNQVLFNDNFFNAAERDTLRQQFAQDFPDVAFPSSTQDLTTLCMPLAASPEHMRFESQFLPVWLPGPQARYYMLNVRVECPAVFQQAAHGAVQAIGAHPTPAGTPLKSAGNGYKRNYEKLVAGQSAYRPIVTAERVSTVEGLFPAARVAATELRTDAPEGTLAYLSQGEPFIIRHVAGDRSIRTEIASSQLRFLSGQAFDPAVEKKGFFINAGGSVWITEWCPDVPTGSEQYLLVGGAQSLHEPWNGHVVPQKGSLQLWHIPTMIAGQETRANDVPRLEMLLLHTFGNAWRAEWCPHGAYDDVQNQPALPDGVLPRIGLLAVLFDDGCLRVFAVPRPMSVRQNLQIFDLATPVTLLLEPVWTGRMPSKITSFAWSTDAEHRYIAAGCVDGTIAVWDLAMALSGDAAIPQPSLVNTVDGAPVVLHQHNNCVRSIAWMPVQEGSDGPSHLASASQDGRVVIHDLRVPKNTYLMLRSLGFMCDIIWPRSLNAVVWSSPDNTVRWSPTEEDGSQGGVQVLGLHAGTIWSLDASRNHNFLASGGADSAVKVVNPVHSSRSVSRILLTLFQMSESGHSRQSTSAAASSSSSTTHSLPRIIDYVENASPSVMNQNRITIVHSDFNNVAHMVQTVRWHPGVEMATWLASGSRSGVVRVESMVAAYEKLKVVK